MNRPADRLIIHRAPVNGGNTTKSKGTIALVANLAWSIYNYRLPVVKALQEEGYRVVVIAPVDESVGELMKHPGIELIALRHFRRNTTNILACLKMIREFQQVYSHLKPDAVIHFGVQANVFGNLAARWAGVKSVCVVTGLGYTFLHQGLVPGLTRLLYRISFLKTAKVVFENQEDLDLMVQLNLLERKSALRVPGCGIDTQHFSPWPPRPANPAGPVFTLIGRLLYDKGLSEFAKAAARLKKEYPLAECWVLGHLDDENPAHIHRTELVQWVKSGFIHYKGATEDVRPIIASSDWVVLPSYREGLSRVLLEAMAMGKPIITTDTPGCRETVIEGENGFIVPTRNTEALYHAMKKACEISQETWQKMGKMGRQKAITEYEAGIVGDAYVSLINTVRKIKAG